MSHAAHSRSVHAALVNGTSRPDSVARPERLDVVVRRVVHGTNITVLAERTAIPRAQLYRYASLADNPSGERVRMPVDHVVPLTLASGRDDLVEYLAREVGGVFVRIPHALDGINGVLAHAAAITAEFADVQRETAAALGDGAITAMERAALDAELEQLVQRATALRTALARKPDARAGR